MGLNVWKERDELRAKLTEAEVKNETLYREFERFRTRSEQQLTSAGRRARADAAAAFLPVYDQLALALQAEGATEAFLTGIRLTQTQLLRSLAEIGVQKMECIGKPFDPQFHEAVEHAQVSGAESGSITEVLREGFFCEEEGIIVRHAMVKVAK